MASNRSHGERYPVDDRPWLEDAACKHLDTNIFFPGRGGQLGLARKICYSCPVRQQCLDFAVENHETRGVWGGTSERERRLMNHDRLSQLAAKRAIRIPTRTPPVCGTDAGYHRHIRGNRGLRPSEPCEACRAAHAASCGAHSRDVA